MQLPPSPYLADIVKHFLILESDINGRTGHRLFPDGHPGIVFQYGDSLTRYADNTLIHPRSFLYGQVSKFHNTVAENNIRLLIVVLQPYGVHALTGIPAHELTDTILSLQLLWGSTVCELEERLPYASHKVQLVESFLAQQLFRYNNTADIIKQTVRLIYQHHGGAAVTQLSASLHIHERQLERKFREQVGISPKQFSNIVRLQYFLKLLRNRPAGVNITGLAYESGYYDQAHMIREFRKSTGITPRQYISVANPLALNFIQI